MENYAIVPEIGETAKMTSVELAELTGKRHDNIKTDIRNLLTRLQLNVVAYMGFYYDRRNRKQTQYLLDRDLTVTLVASYDPAFRYQIIQRWDQLEGKEPVQVPQAGVEQQIKGLWQQTGQALGLLSKEMDTVKQSIQSVESKVSEVLTRNAPPAGYDCMIGLEKFFGISAKKLQILAKQDNVHRSRYVIRTPDGATATITAYHVAQLEQSVDNLLWNCKRPTPHFLEHPTTGRFSRIKLKSATRAATAATRQVLALKE